MSMYGETLRLSIFGASHAEFVGMTLEGLPSGEEIDLAELQAFMDRRAPGRNEYSTPRNEADVPEFLSGLDGNVIRGPSLTAVVRNTDARPSAYADIRNIPRPGHADYPAYVKYGKFVSGGGQFSGRMTAALCVAGGVCVQLLKKRGINIFARIRSIGPVSDSDEWRLPMENGFPTSDPDAGKRMIEWILDRKAEGDSCGGIIECMIAGVPAGTGGPVFGGLENRISAAVFGIPAVKGIEFGDGFALAQMKGSESNDAFVVRENRVETETNRCGGILGGLATGMPILFRVSVKPTPSVAKPQKSVDLETMKETEIRVGGRHDPCVVPRAVPCVEAAAAVAVLDAILTDGKDGEI